MNHLEMRNEPVREGERERALESQAQMEVQVLNESLVSTD